jgi:hypothetical protein
MLSNTKTTQTTFVFSGKHTVRLARDVRCPHCGHLLRAGDVEVTPAGIIIFICNGCHGDILVITETEIVS